MRSSASLKPHGSNRMFQSIMTRLHGVGIIPRLLIVSLLAVMTAVAVVQAWTLHVVEQAEYRAAQAQLDTNFGMLKTELRHWGTDWRLGDDGQLTLDGKPAGSLQQALLSVSALTHGVASVFAGDTRVATTLTGPDGSPAIGTKLAAGPARDAVIGRGETYRGVNVVLGVPHFAFYEPLRDASGRQIGVLSVSAPNSDADAVVNKVIVDSVVAGAAMTVAVALLCWVVLRSTISPLKALAAAVGMIGDGKLDIAVPCAGRTDQLGEIGRAIEILRKHALQARAREEQEAIELAAKERRQQAMDRVTQDFAATISGVLSGLLRSAETMHVAAAETAEAAGNTGRDMASTASDAETSSQNLSRVAAAAEELTASVGEISRQVGEAAAAAGEAVEQARSTDTTVHELAGAAGQIGTVVNLISVIAAQTNLLALNATIEAARAGDAGKGFAVVANEVKVLATQTADATRRISEQITAIQGATGKAAAAVRGVVSAIGRVNDGATIIAGAVDEQGRATKEIAAQVQSVARHTETATRAMLDVSTLAGRSGATSQSVLATVDQVKQMTTTLREEVDFFVTTMRNSDRNQDRRKYERIQGGRATVRLRAEGRAPIEAQVIDISLGGAALSCALTADPGTLVMMTLPGSDTEVPARLVDTRDRSVAITFRQDPSTLAHVGRAMDGIAASSPADRVRAAA